METIDLISFLQNYYGIYHESLRFNTLTHDDILRLFPHVKCCGRIRLRLEDLRSGEVIGVYDKNNHVLFYPNPHLNLDDLKIPTYEEIVEKEEVKELLLDEIDYLSKEELLKVRRKLRLADRRKESFLINTLIRRIKEREPHFYREKKNKLLKKESYYD